MIHVSLTSFSTAVSLSGIEHKNTVGWPFFKSVRMRHRSPVDEEVHLMVKKQSREDGWVLALGEMKHGDKGMAIMTEMSVLGKIKR